MQSLPFFGPPPTPNTNPGDLGVYFQPITGTRSNGAATGHLYQDNPATPGLTYTLTGWAGAEQNALLSDAVLAVEFLDGGGNEIPLSGTELSILPTLFASNGQPFNYRQYTLSAIAPAGTVSVRARASMLGGVSNPAGGAQGYVVDDFSLVVPEPGSFGLISMVAAALFARRRNAA